MRRLLTYSFALVVAASVLGGCSQRIGDFTMVSTKNYERGVNYKMLGRMEGEDKVLVILGIPLGAPNLKTAVDRAIEAGNGVYLANAVIDYGGWNAIIVGKWGYTATGDVYGTAERGDLNNPDIELFNLRETENGLVMESIGNGRQIPVQDITKYVTSK